MMRKKFLFNPNNYIVKHTWRHYSVCDHQEDTPAMRALLQAPDNALVKLVLKDHDTTRVFVAQINGKELVVKRYNIKGFWHCLKRALQPTRAVHCLLISRLLLQNAIKTPKAIAIMENRFGLVRREGFFIYEYITGQSAGDIFTDDTLANADVLQKASNLLRLINTLFKHRLYQRDMNPTNFIFVGDIPYLIDLDGIRQNPFNFSKKKITKLLNRFLQYWDDKPSVKQFFADIIKNKML